MKYKELRTSLNSPSEGTANSSAEQAVRNALQNIQLADYSPAAEINTGIRLLMSHAGERPPTSAIYRDQRLGMLFLLLAFLPLAAAQPTVASNVRTVGPATARDTTPVPPIFKTLVPTVKQFDASTIPGLPTVWLTATGKKASVGYQMGDYITGTPDGPVAITYPWAVMPGGGSGADAGVPHGVILAYKTAGSFNNASSYLAFDMTSLTDPSLGVSNPAGSWGPSGVRAAGVGCGGGKDAAHAGKQVTHNQGLACPVSYNGSVVVGGRWIYLIPDAQNIYPVFVMIDASKRITNSMAYYVWTPPDRSSPLASNPLAGGCTAALQSAGRCPAYGWNGTSFYDGRYVYYPPILDGTQPHAAGANCGTSPGCNNGHGNIAQFDTHCAAGTFPTNFSNNACWSSYDVGNNLDQKAGTWNGVCGQNGNPLKGTTTECATGYLSAMGDGHRYYYLIPNQGSVLTRYDTTAPFQSPTSYTTLDMSKLNNSGFPSSGGGSGNTLCPPGGGACGFGGASIVYTPSNGPNSTEWLYFAPFGVQTAQSGSQILTLSSITARVKIGTIDSTGKWSSVDITASGSTAGWEIFDLNTLTRNPQFAANGWSGSNCGTGGNPGCLYPNGGLVGQSTIAGYQLAWTNTFNTPNRPVYGNCDSRFWVEHDPSKPLGDVSGWYVGYVTSGGPTNNTYGAAYDAATQTAWPGILSGILVQASGI